MKEKDRQAAVFSDLDGILFELVNHFGEYGVSARSPEELKTVPGLSDVLNSLEAGGFLLFGITNQPDIARKKITSAFLEQKHNLLLETYPQVKEIYCCPHTESDICSCRKPKPGLLLAAAKKYELDLSKCWVVGDSRADIEAGSAANTRTVLVQTRYNVGDPSIKLATAVVKSAKAAFKLIVEIADKESESANFHGSGST